MSALTADPLCAYCSEPAEYICAACDRPVCWEHSHSDDAPDYFCDPAPDEQVSHYRRTGEHIGCGERAVR